MNRYDLIIFDMDGTFMDSKLFHREVFYRFLNKYVRPVTHEEVNSGIGATVREIFDSIGVPEEQLEDLFAKLDHYCRTEVDELASKIPAAEDIEYVLDELHNRGIKAALLTNSMLAVTERMLATHNLSNKFDKISGADYYSMNKIDRCRDILSEFATDKVLAVGDAETDIILANKVGCDSCFAKTRLGWWKDENYIKEVLKPTYTVTTLKEMLDIV